MELKYFIKYQLKIILIIDVVWILNIISYVKNLSNEYIFLIEYYLVSEYQKIG